MKEVTEGYDLDRGYPNRIYYGVRGQMKVIGEVSVEIVKGDVVIIVKREDEEKFGPVSLVVV